ncbi:hypothetical protein ADIARSV_1349 [Arcticibacter svalbardensis MN12-7]|uniref:Uncharacterized protein n=1 Tax=Arcticibacter svalbardensis MN12-7 TaxID=1150600 RepID=R9GVH3_9SPHI|nr:hypothetical protein ADIARSV_1349 [Arcticibacter svalbardensis MN12-7]
MEVLEIWEQAVKALPDALSEEFRRAKILLTEDKDKGTIHWHFKKSPMENNLI